MKPPGRTTLTRMQLAALAEAERIEISQDSRVQAKMFAAPMEDQVLLRDDFAGIVRLIDVIQSDRHVLERVVELMKKAPAAELPAAAEADEDIEARPE